MDNYAIVTIGYNKVDSLLRLLNSLNRAEYDGDEITLIISLDHSESDSVYHLAVDYQWKHGAKKVRRFDQRQGLRKHILSCGFFFEQFEGLFIFEDDIIAAPGFYRYGKKCIKKFASNEMIAGISLYSPKWNQNANFPFEPIKKKQDVYFLQYAQSWGQIWLKDSWRDFQEWYGQNEDFFERPKDLRIPYNLYSWGDNSWLKYHIVYCIMKNKFFVCPYYSYTSVFVEKGTHFGTDITRYHSELLLCDDYDHQLGNVDENAVCYNAFFENMNLSKMLSEEYPRIQVDLYGCQPIGECSGFWVSTQILPYTTERKWGLQLRPIECNIMMDIEGEGIFLYNTNHKQTRKRKEVNIQISRVWDYFMKDRFLAGKELIPMCLKKIKNLFHIILYKIGC